MFASGRNQKQLARTRGVRYKTMHGHVTNIHSRLGVSTTLGMVLVAIKEGLIGLDDLPSSN